ncbi:MAG TPA: extracellular solute-binding protein, partial [Candidatus Binatia bacterium]
MMVTHAISRRENELSVTVSLWLSVWLALALALGAQPFAAAAEWDDVVAAAKKEGTVVVANGGGAGSEERRLYTEEFQKQFPGIKVDMTTAGGRSIAPRMLMERRAGKYIWDVYTGGTTTALEYLVPAGVLDPIKPALILPEVKDPKNWFGGAIDFSDNAATHNLVFGGYVKPPLVYNTKFVKKTDIRSYRDLLDPKWKGKIVITDPRRPGSGLAAATFWYGTDGLGKEYIKEFFSKQDVKVSSDYRQQMEWLSRGDYYIAIGHHNGIFNEFLAQGLPLGQLTASDVKEANYVTAAV